MAEEGGCAGERKVVFGKYEIGRLLGRGTFAKVYHGKHLATGESVAIKVIAKEEVKREQGIAGQIVREISILALVRHPHVVELREVMATKSRIFFVMEHVRGGELFARVARGKLGEDEARLYFQQLISAVDYCHSRGISHRDLKPENLLLDGSGDLKVSDFGLSALPEQLRHDGLLHTQCGTPAYVAPEVLRKKGYDGGRADLWSCGVILYVLLAGFLPFQDESLLRVYRKIFKAEFEFPPWFSSGARRLLSRLLVADPAKRITVPEITQDLWFRKDFSHPPAFSVPRDPATEAVALREAMDAGEAAAVQPEGEEENGAGTPPPTFYNAFELISAMSSGFDLSGLFEGEKTLKRRPVSMFTSRWGAGAIARRLERVGRALGFGVRRAAKEDGDNPYKVRLEGAGEGRKGRLEVAAEVFQVAAGLAVVELSKSAGDTLEYVKFCEEDVRPALQDIVWTWRSGDSCWSVGDDGTRFTTNECSCGGAT